VVVGAETPDIGSVVAAAAASQDSALAGLTTRAHIDMKQVAEEGGKRRVVDMMVGVDIDIEVEQAEAEGTTVAAEEDAVAAGMDAVVEVGEEG